MRRQGITDRTVKATYLLEHYPDRKVIFT